MPATTPRPLPSRQPPHSLPVEHLEGTHWIEALRDGSRVLIRPLVAADRERERALIERLSPTSRRLRFLANIGRVTPAMIDQLMDVHAPERMALIALAHHDGELREVGVARYAASGGANRCECAVAVADDWRQRGLGAMLMRHLIEVARRNGFRQMYSVDSAANGPMRELARHLGFRCQRDPDDATQLVCQLDL